MVFDIPNMLLHVDVYIPFCLCDVKFTINITIFTSYAVDFSVLLGDSVSLQLVMTCVSV